MSVVRAAGYGAAQLKVVRRLELLVREHALRYACTYEHACMPSVILHACVSGSNYDTTRCHTHDGSTA